jgi:hypothetical protein
MQSLTDLAHERVRRLDWKPSYVQPKDRYPSKYTLPNHTKDAFRHLIRQYCAMEEEKDNRQYGSLTDVITRTGSVRNVGPRWAEIQKIILPILTSAEYGAAKGQGVLIDSVDNPELRQGYLAQMMDEIRHYNQEAYLLRYWTKHWPDSEGFASSGRHKGRNLFARAGRSLFETFFTGDPVSVSLHLQVMAETAYTNSVFVAMTELAARQGDNATPTVFLSIQSDEARHMANGYSTLVAALSEPANLPYLQQDLDDAFWRGSRFLDPFLGWIYDYGAEVRAGSYAELWDKWTWEDWGGRYMARLEPYGVKPPASMEAGRQLARTGQHAVAMFVYAAWPLQFWRYDAPTERDFEWLEDKYSGWYEKYGLFYDMYHAMTDPADGALPLGVFAEGRLPVICRVCQMPAVFPEFTDTSEIIVKKGDRWEGFCSPECESLFDREPLRYSQYVPFLEQYDGWNLADVILDLGLIRKDGRTLLAQPTLSSERMWTVDDIRRCDVVLQDPVRQYVEDGNAE